MIIDVHTHAFPDVLARRAVPSLEAAGDARAFLDGTIGSLLDSMDEAGVDVSVVASIATRPEQFDSILTWSRSIASRRIVPFPSVHPLHPRALDQITEIRTSGFVGIKLHPYYQDFTLTDSRILSLFGRIEREGLVLLLHTGYDMAYARTRLAAPAMVAEVLRSFDALKLIATHFGGWEEWDEVERHLLGRDVYIDTSYSIPFLGAARAREFLDAHPAARVLFGSDSPWASQLRDIEAINALDIEEGRRKALLGGNAQRLLGLT